MQSAKICSTCSESFFEMCLHTGLSFYQQIERVKTVAVKLDLGRAEPWEYYKFEDRSYIAYCPKINERNKSDRNTTTSAIKVNAHADTCVDCSHEGPDVSPAGRHPRPRCSACEMEVESSDMDSFDYNDCA